MYFTVAISPKLTGFDDDPGWATVLMNPTSENIRVARRLGVVWS